MQIMKVKHPIILCLFFLISISSFSQGGADGHTDAEEHRRARKEKARLANEKKEREARKKKYADITEFLAPTGATIDFEDSMTITRVTYNFFDDDSVAITTTRTDGSTQNTFIEDNGREEPGTAGTDSHGDFVREAIEVKEANGVKEFDSPKGKDF